MMSDKSKDALLDIAEELKKLAAVLEGIMENDRLTAVELNQVSEVSQIVKADSQKIVRKIIESEKRVESSFLDLGEVDRSGNILSMGASISRASLASGESQKQHGFLDL